jgi:hypothetical protein
VILWLLIACDPEPDPLSTATAPWPQDPDALLPICDSQPFEELAVTCRVQAASFFGLRGQPQRAAEVCAMIPEGIWRDECHFRAGEELGRAGYTIPGLTHCAQAGRFARNCITHAAWRLPREPDLAPEEGAEIIGAAWSELSVQVTAVLEGIGDGLEGEGLDLVQARFAYNVYVGSGQTDPAAAHLPHPLGGALRTGMAIEVVRLMEAAGQPATVAGIVDIYTGAAPPMTGAPVTDREHLGRYHTPILSPHEAGQPHLPVYGGGLRLASLTANTDMVLAALEALYWLPHTPADTFQPWLESPEPDIRRTAAKLMRLCVGQGFDIEEALNALATEHPDEGVQWHAKDGLERRSFEERGAAPPPPGVPLGPPPDRP